MYFVSNVVLHDCAVDCNCREVFRMGLPPPLSMGLLFHSHMYSVSVEAIYGARYHAVVGQHGRQLVPKRSLPRRNGPTWATIITHFVLYHLNSLYIPFDVFH